MDVLTEEELASRLDYMRSLHPEPEKRESTWCIPFEWGGNVKGTKISVSKAREIASELRAQVAEYEKRELRHALDQERERTNSLGKQLSEAQLKVNGLQGEVALLNRALRKARRR